MAEVDQTAVGNVTADLVAEKESSEEDPLDDPTFADFRRFLTSKPTEQTKD